MILLDTSILSTFARVGVLRLLWTSGLRPKEFVRRLLERMEQGEGLVLKNREMIFKSARKSR